MNCNKCRHFNERTKNCFFYKKLIIDIKECSEYSPINLSTAEANWLDYGFGSGRINPELIYCKVCDVKKHFSEMEYFEDEDCNICFECLKKEEK